MKNSNSYLLTFESALDLFNYKSVSFKYLVLFIIMFMGTFSLYAQSLNYNVSVRRLLSTQGKEHFRFLDDDARRDFVNNYQFPQHSTYILHVGNDYSATSNQDKHFLDENNLPLGKGKSFRVKNEPIVISEYVENNYASSDLKDIIWTESKRDSVILDLKVHEATGKHLATGTDYTIWYTKDLPKGLGIHNLVHKDGFVIAFKSILNNPDDLTKKLVIHAFPDRKVNLSNEVVKGIDNKVKIAVNSVNSKKSTGIKAKSRKI